MLLAWINGDKPNGPKGGQESFGDKIAPGKRFKWHSADSKSRWGESLRSPFLAA